MGTPVVSPVDKAVEAVKEAWRLPEARASLGSGLLKLDNLDVALGASARIDTDLSWRHVAKPRKRSPRAGAFVNYEQIVFRATAPEVELRVSNAAAPDGSELGVNYVSLCPFFPE